MPLLLLQPGAQILGVVYPTLAVELELSIGVWTNVTVDVLLDQGFSFRYGMAGGGPMDRVGDTGWCHFSLDNSRHNSAGLLGYYSPLHTNVRGGFTFGIGVRIKFTYAGIPYYKWRGRVKEIEPAAGLFQDRVTRCMAIDWMAEPAQYDVREVALQVSQRSDQVFSAVLAKITRQPAAQSIAAGKDTYAFALDNIGRGDHPPATSVFQDIAMSELGFVFIKGDSVQGETLVFENRHARPLATANTVTFADDMVGVQVPRTLDRIWTRVEVVTHPKKIDSTATTVLFSADSNPVVQPNETITMWGDYRDPTQKLALVGGTAMVPPVATTDYVANGAADGSGANLTANMTVTATFFAASVKLDLANNGSTTAYFTLLQCRGKGLYDYQPETSLSDSASAQTSYGLRVLAIDMPYQESRVNGQGAADWLLNLYSAPARQVDTVTFIANRNDRFMTAALAREISDRIGVTETVTGVSVTGRGWYINAVEFDVQPTAKGPRIACTWTLAPSDTVQAWILEDATYGVLGTTTTLGYL